MHNPSAGDGSEGDEIERVATDRGHSVTLVDRDDDWLGSARSSSPDLLVVAGGDGTVREVLTVIARAEHAPECSVAVLPLGTANNIARSLGLDVDDPWTEIDSWACERRPVDFDVADVESEGDRHAFVESYGGGFVAAAIASADGADQVVEDGNEHGRHHLLDLLERAEAIHWTVVIDGEDRSGQYLAVEVMNVPTVGPILPVAPSANPHDGRLDVVCITEASRELLRSTIVGTYDGSALELLGGSRAVEVVVAAPSGVPMHLDDELFDSDGMIRRIAIGRSTVPVLDGGVRQD